MTINVGHLYKKKLVKDTAGNIIDLYNEADGGWIIKSRQIVNLEKYEELQRKEKEKIEAAKIVAEAMSNPTAFENPNAPDRNYNPSKYQELEKKVENMEGKLDAILQAISNKNDRTTTGD